MHRDMRWEMTDDNGEIIYTSESKCGTVFYEITHEDGQYTLIEWYEVRGSYDEGPYTEDRERGVFGSVKEAMEDAPYDLCDY